MNTTKVEQAIKQHEGWRSRPYKDPVTGVLTFGWGFTYLTKEEGEIIIQNRIKARYKALLHRLPNFKNYPGFVQNTLVEMSYQLGVHGLLRFTEMIKALDKKDYKRAAKEIENSRLFKETPNRARAYITNLSKGQCSGRTPTFQSGD